VSNLFESGEIDVLIISSGTNRRYFSGWSAEDHAPDRPSGVMLVTPESKVLYASATNLPWAEAEVLDDVSTAELKDPWPVALARDITARGLRRVGFEDSLTSVANYWELARLLGTSAELVPVGHSVDDLRRVKSERELGLIRQALALTDTAFERAAARLREGMTEAELAAFIDQQFRDLGSDGQAFDTIVASGPNAAKPHHAPGNRQIQAGEPVIIDMGARVEGYCGDLTRTIWAGQPSERLGTMYRLVAESQRAAFAAIKDGVEARAVDDAARAIFAAQDVEHNFVHGLGHAIGLQIHESPFMGQRSDDVLRAGNIITVEPGLYFPDWGGVRIEDVVVVEDNGFTNLTHAPKLLEAGS
jgi:Xaa-Pro aminopeptidase